MTDTSSDPSNFLSTPNLLLKIVNTGRQDLNGQCAQALNYIADRERYTVAVTLPSSRGHTALSLKPENLVRATLTEKIKFRASQARRRLQETSNDPQIREMLRRSYVSIQSRLPAYVKPEHLACAFLLLLLLAIRTFGFSRTILFFSLISMPIAVAAPDLGDVKVAARNFPRRLRETVVQITGYSRISERVAMGGFILLFLFSTKILLTTPMARKSENGKAIPAMSQTIKASSSAPVESSVNIDAIYKLGFQDALDGKEYGTSLPDVNSEEYSDLTSNNLGAPTGLSESDDIKWQYNPSPPSDGNVFSKFGIGRIFSIFAIFRTLKELAREPNGTMSVNAMITNFKRMESWKLGVFGFCLFNILRGLF